MAIKASKLDHMEPVYTWVADDGSNIHIASRLLRDWCMKRQPRVELMPVDHDFAASFLRENTVDPMRVLQLSVECDLGIRKLDPIILCQRGTYTHGLPDVMLVDGHHRYVLAAMKEWPVIPCYNLIPHQWKRFRVVDCPDVTKDQLAASPITQRNY